MKTKSLSIILFGLLLFTNCFAQKESKKDKKTLSGAVATPVTTAVSDAVEQVPITTEECLVNISLFNESAKNKQYADALAPWNAAYLACPGANKVIYTRGRDILQWKLGQTKDEALYKSTFDELMGMYDNRVKYFGKDVRYPTPWILGLKALDYITFSKEDVLKKTAYGWLEQSIDGMGEKSELEVLRQFVVLSTAIFQADKTHTEKYITDFLKANSILEQKGKDSDSIKAKISIQLKQSLEFLFSQSGAANCNTLDGIYQAKIKENLSNLEYLNNTMNFYKRIHCTESQVYFAAAVASHKLQPTAESANGCAEMSYKKTEYPKAISFYEEATKLSTDKLDKADYQYKIAQIYYGELDNFAKAREFARNSLEYNPNNGSPYLLIGIMYAKTKGISDDPVLAKSVYWVAVDKFQKAKQVDSGCAADADKLIRTYSGHFPSKDDIFFQPNLQAGKSYFVGGWIGESTICR